MPINVTQPSSDPSGAISAAAALADNALAAAQNARQMVLNRDTAIATSTSRSQQALAQATQALQTAQDAQAAMLAAAADREAVRDALVAQAAKQSAVDAVIADQSAKHTAIDAEMAADAARQNTQDSAISQLQLNETQDDADFAGLKSTVTGQAASLSTLVSQQAALATQVSTLLTVSQTHAAQIETLLNRPVPSPIVLATGAASLPTQLLAGASTTVTVPLSLTFVDAGYSASVTLAGAGAVLGVSRIDGVTTRTPSSITVRVTNTGLSTILVGALSIMVTAMR